MDKRLKDYADKVNLMRKNQRRYFKTRKSEYLIMSKELESEVDKMTADILDTQQSLFNEKG